MRLTIVIIVLTLIGAAAYWYVTENAKEERAQVRLREKERISEERARIKKMREDDERIRKERMVEIEKQDAVRLLLRYIDREEQRLKNFIAEKKLELEKISIDQESLSSELAAIERANSIRVASKTKRGERHRDKVERVSALLRSPTLNRLSLTYCDEDLSALRSKFEAEVQRIVDVEDRYQKQLTQNTKNYEKSIEGMDEDVDKKTKRARDMTKKIDVMAGNRIPELKKRVEAYRARLNKLESKKVPSSWDKKEMELLRRDLAAAEAQYAQAVDVTGITAANIAHVEATEAETHARRVYDRAGVKLARDDNEALRARVHENEIYGIARQFENASLDRIRNAIKEKMSLFSTLIFAAQQKLNGLQETTSNIDLVKTPGEVEAIRVRIAKTLSDNITGPDSK